MFPLTSHWPKLSSQDDSACKEGKKMSISGSHVPIWKFYYYRRRGKHICKDILYFLPAVLIFAFPKYVFYPSGANFVWTLGKQPNLTLLSCLSGNSLHHVWLCDSMDYSPPGSSVHGNSPGKNPGVACHALLQGIFPIYGSNSHLISPALAGEFFTTSATWKALTFLTENYYSSFIFFPSHWSIMPVLTSFHIRMGLSQRSLFWIFLVYLFFSKPILCHMLFKRHCLFFLKNIFFLWRRLVLVAACGVSFRHVGSPSAMWGLLLPCGVSFRHVGSSVAAHSPSSCGTGSVLVTPGLSCSIACSILVPKPGIVSLAL